MAENLNTAATIVEKWECGNSTTPPLTSTQLRERLSTAGPGIIAPLCVPPVLLAIMVILYIDEILFFYRQKDLCKRRRTSYIWVLSAYPMIGLCCVLGLFIPAAGNDLSIALNFYFGFCVKKFFELNLDFYGGKRKVAEYFGSTTIIPNLFPCCFVVCCCRNQPMTVPRLKKLHMVINQLLFVFPAIIFIKAILKADGLGRVRYGALLISVLDLMATASNFTALYPFVTLGRSSAIPLRQYFLRGKYLSLQLVVGFNAIQRFVLKVIDIFGDLDCNFPYPNNDSAYLYHSYLLVYELFGLSLLAWYSYRRSDTGCRVMPLENGDDQVVAIDHLGKSTEGNNSQDGSFTVQIEDEPTQTTEKNCYSNFVESDAL